MGRISEAELSRLKREVSVQRLAEAAGVKLAKHGKDLLGLCPFHDDKEPSLVISPAKNLWNCLGACGEGGSVVDWVMKERGVSFRHAVEVLRGDLGVVPPVEGAEAELSAQAEDGELLGQVVEYYHQTLKESPEALEYLESRGLVHPEVVEHFQLGFANRSLGYRLPNKQLKAGKDVRGRLQELGVLRKTGHEHFNGSLVIPVFDEAGQVVELYGRKVTRGTKLRKGTPLHLYLPGPHRGVFNREALGASPEVILCESLIDALTFWCAGYRNVTSAFGVNGFTEEMVEVFEAARAERVLIAFDRDEAGERAAKKVAQRLREHGMGCWRVLFPRGMDANEYALKVTPATESLGLVLRKAAWMGEGEAPERRESATLGSRAVESKAAEAAASPPSLAAKEELLPEARVPPAAPAPEAPPAPLEPFAGSVLPAPPPPEIPAQVKEQEVVIVLGDRRYRVRGLERNLSYDVLKVNLLASRGEAFHVDTLDLYAARQRGSFQKAVAVELGVEEGAVKTDLGKVLLKLEELQDAQIRAALEPEGEPVVELSEGEREAALELLKDPDLLRKILEDFEACGVVGEETNKLVGFLAATSRLLEKPLAIVVQSSSSAGKSSLMEAVLSLIPGEHQVKYSAMTGQSLFYMGETNLSHKILAIVEEEGAEKASYALKLLQSEGELTIASTGKDPSTGRLVTHEYRVEGPVMIFLTTTAIDIDEELLNRCLVLSVDEAREQTRAIHRLQRERRTLEGLLARTRKEAVLELHQNAQRLLRPLSVVNPFAPELTFLDTQIRTRRDHEKYLTLIDSIALLHQHQREVKSARVEGREVEYLEVELGDIEIANQLAHEVLGRSLDELPPQTRRLLGKLDEMVSEGCEKLEMERCHFRFTRSEVRAFTGWGDTQLRLHLERLAEMEYVVVHEGGRGRIYVYELLWQGDGPGPAGVLPGLIEPSKLSESTGTTRTPRGLESTPRGEGPENAGPSRPHRGGSAGGPRGGVLPMESETYPEDRGEAPKTHSRGVEKPGASHRKSRRTPGEVERVLEVS